MFSVWFVVIQTNNLRISNLTSKLFPGYPNLTSFIQAFPDIFVFTHSKTNIGRSEISVNPKCISKKFNQYKLPFFNSFLNIYYNFSVCKSNNNNLDSVNYNRTTENPKSLPCSDSMLQKNELMDLESSVHNSNLCGTLKNAGPIDDFSISYNNDFEIQYPMNSTCFIEPTESFNVNQRKELSSKKISSQDDKKFNFDNCKNNSK